ncbi:MAG: hypothetical protein IJB90_03240 [Clostridia bacterium]|nr:hypothetical protein [Clostridia bacterium]
MYSTTLNDEDFETFDELITIIETITKLKPERIVLIADGEDLNETQMSIYCGNHCILVEDGNNTTMKALANLIDGKAIDEDREWDASAILSESYANFNSKITSNADWKKYVDKLVKSGSVFWATIEAGNEEEISVAEGLASRYSESEIEKIINKYGYQEASVKSKVNDSYYWELNDGNGNVENYEFRCTLNNTYGTYTYTIIRTTYNLDSLKTGETKLSTSYELKNAISKWYVTLRTIALVGLLSVLVYVGIRIIISSTGQEKAKYKKMIGDWLAAICILFVLHYIMAFTMTIVENILDIFKIDNIVSATGEDVFMTSIRQSVNTTGTLSTSFAELLIYLVLVVYTAIFTFHYLKRLVYLAFFTMIAPLIALTYPLDKIKDRTSTSVWNVDKGICV